MNLYLHVNKLGWISSSWLSFLKALSPLVLSLFFFSFLILCNILVCLAVFRSHLSTCPFSPTSAAVSLRSCNTLWILGGALFQEGAALKTTSSCISIFLNLEILQDLVVICVCHDICKWNPSVFSELLDQKFLALFFILFLWFPAQLYHFTIFILKRKGLSIHQTS